MRTAPPVISSLQNDFIKNVVRLRQRSHRDEQGQFLIEGFREVTRAIENGWIPAQLITCPALADTDSGATLKAACTANNIQILECTEPVFRKIAYRENPDGVLAVAPQRKLELHSLKLPADPLLVVAESVEKPGNLGTILRSSDAAGADAVIICDPRTDLFNPNVVRASTGTLFSMPLAAASSMETISWLKQHRIQMVASTPHAESLYTNVDFRKPSAIILGTEESGLSSAWLDASPVLARIPMHGNADSLNVSAAATILLFEAVRQRS
jgi:RNA methyltransferase, TrmH family